ncbi:LOW QUALITY PROTEIN: ATP-binding cassette (ABC) Superfamily, partial [Phytophthora palmivora]
MPKEASTRGASPPSKSKTAKAKSKNKATPRKEVRKAASEAGSKRTAAAAGQEGSSRRSRSRSLSLDDRPNPRFAYRDHSHGSESDGDSPGSAKDPPSSQDAPSQDAPAQDTPVDNAESSEAKAALTSSPAKNLSLTEGKARAQSVKAASPKRADEGAAAAKKRTAPGSPTSEPSIAKGFKSLFDSSDEEEEEGAVSEPREISNDLDEQQERYQAAQLQGTPVPPTPVYPRGYHPPDAGSGSSMFLEHLKAPRGLNHGRTSRGAYERALSNHSLSSGLHIEAARCVLLAPHQIPLKEFTSLRKKPEDRGGLFPVWGYPWVQPKNTTTQTQAEDLFWRWVSLKNFTVQELIKELREDRLLSYVLDQRDLRIEFAHLVAKRQLHSVMEGLRLLSKSRVKLKFLLNIFVDIAVKAAKKPRTTYAPAVDPKSQQPSGSQPGAGLPAPTSSVTRGNPVTSLADGASQGAAGLGRTSPHS